MTRLAILKDLTDTKTMTVDLYELYMWGLTR